MEKVPVAEAVGMILCQDITKIVPGEFKGRAFKKGHVIKEEDVEVLLNLGKENIYVWAPEPGDIHENDAALRLSKATVGENIIFTEPYEGKSTLVSQKKGLFKVNSEVLFQINSVDTVSIASLPNNFPVEKEQKLAGARIIPLVTKEERIEEVEALCRKHGPVFTVKPYKKLKCAVITTGSEVYKGRIKDKFGPVMKDKILAFDGDFMGQEFCPDDLETIAAAIQNYVARGAELIILTGGMSVDPDDLTPGAIKKSGARIVTYGVPAQPGNMFLMAYLGKTALMGVPGCAMFCRTTVLDVVLPRVFAGEELMKEEFIRMGEGGFCSGCKECTYPNCYFGR